MEEENISNKYFDVLNFMLIYLQNLRFHHEKLLNQHKVDL
jgi:hypothetical protein